MQFGAIGRDRGDPVCRRSEISRTRAADSDHRPFIASVPHRPVRTKRQITGYELTISAIMIAAKATNAATPDKIMTIPFTEIYVPAIPPMVCAHGLRGWSCLIGFPQAGQAKALSDTLPPHSAQIVKAISILRFDNEFDAPVLLPAFRIIAAIGIFVFRNRR